MGTEKTIQRYPDGSVVKVNGEEWIVIDMSRDSDGLLPSQVDRGEDFNLYRLKRHNHRNLLRWQHDLDAENLPAPDEEYTKYPRICTTCQQKYNWSVDDIAGRFEAFMPCGHSWDDLEIEDPGEPDEEAHLAHMEQHWQEQRALHHDDPKF